MESPQYRMCMILSMYINSDFSGWDEPENEYPIEWLIDYVRVYKDKNGKWIAEYTIGWDDNNGELTRRKRKKRGFATKNEAIAYIPQLKQDLPQQDMNVKFKDLYKKWLDRHTEKVTQSTINCYK